MGPRGTAPLPGLTDSTSCVDLAAVISQGETMVEIQSFEVTGGAASGDLLSERHGDRPLKVGLLACGFFEYWRMYAGLREQVQGDMQTIADRLAAAHDVVFPGLVETLDGADHAGQVFRDQHVDLVVVAEGTYCPDYFIHQALLHLPTDMPLVIFASQAHDRLNFHAGYDQSLRNSGPMGLVQLTGGFRKMGKYPGYEVVVGAVGDDEPYAEIAAIIQVHTTLKNLKHMTIGTIGHVFRGMYDFNFDKTAVTGKLGPHVMDIQMDHLVSILDEIDGDDPRVSALQRKVHGRYNVSGLSDAEIARSARLAVAIRELVDRFRLDGLVLLGQHLIEARANAAVYLGLSELLSSDRAVAVTEGDVIGCVMSKVLKDFTGLSPFFGEWEEVDVSLNAVMLLGHGFVDPRAVRKDRPVNVKPACENWGFEGNSLGFEATYPPGPVTLAHAIHDVNGWWILVSKGELLDTEPLEINESSMIVCVDKPVKAYFRELVSYGFTHHVIAVSGDVTAQLECFARQAGLEVCRL
jgi:L-arabinose isomerase